MLISRIKSVGLLSPKNQVKSVGLLDLRIKMRQVRVRYSAEFQFRQHLSFSA
jgi:hypothetical protein